MRAYMYFWLSSLDSGWHTFQDEVVGCSYIMFVGIPHAVHKRNITGTFWHQSLPSFALRVNVCLIAVVGFEFAFRFGNKFRIEVSGVTSCLKFGCGLMLFWEAFSFTLLVSVASLTRKFSFRVLASGLNFAWEVKAMLLNINWFGQHIRFWI